MGYKGLATAIIYQAVKDYRRALEWQESRKEGTRERGQQQEEDMMIFFRSQWCEFLGGDMDMGAFIERLSKCKKPKTMLKEWRLSKGFTQKRAADFIGVRANSYSKWEHAANDFYLVCNNQVIKNFMTKLNRRMKHHHGKTFKHL